MHRSTRFLQLSPQATQDKAPLAIATKDRTSDRREITKKQENGKFFLNTNPTAQLTANSSTLHQVEPKTSTTRRNNRNNNKQPTIKSNASPQSAGHFSKTSMTRRDDGSNNKQPTAKSNTSLQSSGHFSKTSMTNCNSRIITSSPQQGVTYTREIQNTTRKPVRLTVTIATQSR